MTQHKCWGCGSIFIGEGNYCRVCIKNGLQVASQELPMTPISLDKRVGIIITTLNQWSYTRDCLQSLRANTEYPIDTIVLDGASTDGTPDRLRSEFPYVKLIELDRPYWISYAWNRALEHALDNGYDYIGILNNDILFSKKWLSYVLHCFDDPNVGYASPIQTTKGGTIRDMGKNRLGYFDITLHWSGAHEVPVMWMPGACILLRREAVEDVGFFDESFFFGNDEVDYCMRLWLNGWKVVSTSHTKIVHYVSKTISQHGGKEGKRTKELKEEYGVTYVHPRQRFYEKWDVDTIKAIWETVRPMQNPPGFNDDRAVRIWTPSL